MPSPFSDPTEVASYVERAHRTVPALPLLHQIIDQLIAEAVPRDGRVLVVGAGGGLELKHFAQQHDGWSFDGVDPSAPMLDLARTTLGELAARVALHEGEVAAAPAGPFDAATCLLVMHFLTPEQRLETLREIRQRMRPGAPLAVCHISVPAGELRTLWLGRFIRLTGATEQAAAASAQTMADRLPILSPEKDQALLHEAGFKDVELFYAALALRGWIARA